MSELPDELRDVGDKFVYDLMGVYDMEVKLADALDELSRTATNDNLRKGFAVHANETAAQVRRAEAAFEALGEEPARRDNRVVDGLLAETEQFETRATDGGLRDLHYLTAAIETERVEITSYEGLLRTAEAAGLGSQVTDPLAETLAEEEKTLRKLEGLAGGGGLKALARALLGR